MPNEIVPVIGVRLPQKNRRIAARRPFKGKIKATCYKGLLDLGQNIAVKLLDVSESGMSLTVSIALEKPQEVLILLESQRHASPIKTPGVVMWCIPSGQGNWTVGIQFGKYLSYANFTHFT